MSDQLDLVRVHIASSDVRAVHGDRPCSLVTYSFPQGTDNIIQVCGYAPKRRRVVFFPLGDQVFIYTSQGDAQQPLSSAGTVPGFQLSVSTFLELHTSSALWARAASTVQNDVELSVAQEFGD